MVTARSGLLEVGKETSVEVGVETPLDGDSDDPLRDFPRPREWRCVPSASSPAGWDAAAAYRIAALLE